MPHQYVDTEATVPATWGQARPGKDRCPVCGNSNRCLIGAEQAYNGACWCNGAAVPSHILRFIAEKLETACLCKRCLDSLSYYAQYLYDPRIILGLLHQEIREDPNSPDFYSDDQGLVVFTAAYHLKRGHCCENSCRHCPYSLTPDRLISQTTAPAK